MVVKVKTPLQTTRVRMKNVAIAISMAAAFSSAFAETTKSSDTDPAVRIVSFSLPEGVDSSLLAAYTGDAVTFSQIDAARQAVQRELDRIRPGYVAVLPSQDITTGIVRITAEDIRTRVGVVTAPEDILVFFPSAQSGAPVNAVATQEEAEIFKDLFNVQPAVEWKPAEDHTADLRIDAGNTTTVIAALDNSGTPQTGDHRVTVFAKGPVLSNNVAYAAAVVSAEKPGDVAAVVAGYRVPIYQAGMIVETYGSQAKANVGAVGPLYLTGSGSSFGLRASKFLPLAGGGQSVFVGIEERTYHTTTKFGDQDLGLIPDYHLRPLTLGYQMHRGGWRADAAVIRGMDNTPLDNVRAGANPGYQIVRSNMEYAQPLGDFTLRVAGTLQYTNDALPNGEQLGLGGANSIRGYNERVMAFDSGYSATMELHHPAPFLDKLDALIFTDWGDGTRNKALASEISHSRLASVGLGVRWSDELSPYAIRWDIAQALVPQLDAPKGSWRTHFSFIYRF